MKKLNEESAKEYALNKFEQMSGLYFRLNVLHSKGIVRALKILSEKFDFDKNKLFALVWVHDIGKIVSNENHAKISVEVLEKDFKLDNVEKDCILNHGSSGNPKTREGKVFRYADGLSLFTPGMIHFRFWVGAKEGKSFEEVEGEIEKAYKKYKVKYSDSKDVLEILEDLYRMVLQFVWFLWNYLPEHLNNAFYSVLYDEKKTNLQMRGLRKHN